jgi:anti-sigma factor RsiW
MTRSDSDDKSVLLVHAYLDGELDPANALGIAQQMSTDAALAAESERVKALQRLIRERLPREEAPPGLRPRIEASVGGVRRQHAQPSWRALAASIALTAMVTGSSTWLVVGSQQQQPTMVADALVSDHIRALMAAEPVDVVSSDRHTVKPWFNGRIPNSPRVVDLAKDNFPLIGGRIDVVGQMPVPTLVYRHAKHHQPHRSASGRRFQIGQEAHAALTATTSSTGLRRRELLGDLDLEAKELEDFARLFRTSQTEL